jgi:outer membrane protein
MRGSLVWILLASMATLAHAAAAGPDGDCQARTDDCVAVGRWNFSVSLGAGIRTNPLISGRDIPLEIVPQVSYYGSHFFLDNLDLGVTLVDSDANTLSLVASPGYDRVFFYRYDLQNIFLSGFAADSLVAVKPVSRDTQGAVQLPSRARRVTYLAGPEWTFKFEGVTGQLDVLHEITAQNHGNEVRAALGIPLLEKDKGSSLALNVGATWESAAIVNYYYGEPIFYMGGSSLNPFVKVRYGRSLAGKWRLDAFVEYERLGAAIADSPIIANHYVVTAFVGATYPF